MITIIDDDKNIDYSKQRFFILPRETKKKKSK